MGSPDSSGSSGNTSAPTTVTLNYQGPLDLLEAAVTGLQPYTSYTLGYVPNPGDPDNNFQPLSTFMTNAAGAQIVESIGPLRQVEAETPQSDDRRDDDRRSLVIVPTNDNRQPVQVQLQSQQQ
jgi:hypothetical protein